jgi:L-threonylcarbamoyladenylate synthase
MKTEVLNTNSPLALKRASELIASGGLIAYPTDTVYGLSSSLLDEAAIGKIFTAKGRDFNKAIAILVGSPAQLPLITNGFTASANLLAKRFWPGALTLILPIRQGLPPNLSPSPTIGVRMPDHQFALELLNKLGPLATTSANLSGQPDAKTAEDVLTQLDGRIDLILNGGACPGGIPSTVVDCTKQQPVILREGAISRSQIEDAFGS